MFCARLPGGLLGRRTRGKRSADAVKRLLELRRGTGYEDTRGTEAELETRRGDGDGWEQE